MVGDEICVLKAWLMHPYPGKLTEEQLVFCYRQSRVGRVIGNAFGILVFLWRSLIRKSVENVERYVRAAIVLLN